MFKRDWTPCSKFVTHNKRGGGVTWPSYGSLCQWTLMIHNNSGLAQRLSGINPGFFRCVFEHKEITISLSE